MSQEELKEILRLYKDDDIEYYNLCSNLGYDKLLNYINNLKEENQRLNNVLNELEKWLEDKKNLVGGCGITIDYIYAYENVLDYLSELKESDK